MTADDLKREILEFTDKLNQKVCEATKQGLVVELRIDDNNDATSICVKAKILKEV